MREPNVDTQGSSGPAEVAGVEGAGARILPFPDLIGDRRRSGCATIRDEFDTLPDTRMELVRRAQERIRNGFYDRPEVVREVLALLIMDIGNDRRPDGPHGPSTDARGV